MKSKMNLIFVFLIIFLINFENTYPEGKKILKIETKLIINPITKDSIVKYKKIMQFNNVKSTEINNYNDLNNEIYNNKILISIKNNYEININDDLHLISEILFYDLNGNIIFKPNLESKNGNYIINISNFQTGLYFIKIIYSNSKVIFYKFIK